MIAVRRCAVFTLSLIDFQSPCGLRLGPATAGAFCHRCPPRHIALQQSQHWAFLRHRRWQDRRDVACQCPAHESAAPRYRPRPHGLWARLTGRLVRSGGARVRFATAREAQPLDAHRRNLSYRGILRRPAVVAIAVQPSRPYAVMKVLTLEGTVR